MKIRVAGLDEGHNLYSVLVSPGEFELDNSFYRNEVCVNLDVEKLSGKIPVKFEISIDVNLVCDRCSEDFKLNITGKGQVIFIQRETHMPDEMPGDDLRSFNPNQAELDITADIRDTLLLSLPHKLLCKEDCKGMCADCGTNLNLNDCTCKKTLEQE